jgi:hypothetical protein
MKYFKVGYSQLKTLPVQLKHQSPPSSHISIPDIDSEGFYAFYEYHRCRQFFGEA